MKKYLLWTVGLILACGLVVAGEKASVGYDGKLVFEAAKIVVAPRLMNAVWDTCARKGRTAAGADGETAFVLQEPSGGPDIVAGCLRAALADGRVTARWTLDVKQDYTGNAFFLELTLPTEIYGGGWISVDGRRVRLPVEKRPTASLGEWTSGRHLEVGRTERVLEVEIPEGAEILAQDNRKWNDDTVSVRISFGACVLKSGETRTLEVGFATSDGVGELAQGKMTILPGTNWVPFHDTTKIAPGSALDFSSIGCADAPAGKYGRVVRRGAHFEFANKPGVPQRFYGVNLCFGANYLNKADAEELVERLVRTGYNALRIHHYESLLCETTDGTTIRPEKMAELDNLLNACIARGLYVTTDLFVSRNVPYRSCGIDRAGHVPMQQFKELILFHDGAFQNYLAFSRALLNHVNPVTGRRWADEPALAFLALVNEGNPGNLSYGFLKSLPEAKAAWRKWLAERKAQEPEVYADITEAIPGNCWQNSRQNAAYCLFLADVEIAFARKMKAFIRDEIKSEVLLTDLSCWKNPICLQLTRQEYDYVDDHFYEDHPTFLETPWQLPSQCPNTNPVRGRNKGFEPVALHRLLDRPFAITEFNYSGPGQYRGIGGIMLGAQASLQDYDGIWRFTWTHDPVSVLNPNPLAYFDVSRDPLQRMTERAVVALYLRRDLRPLSRTLAVVLPEAKVRTDLSCGPHKDIQDMWYGWFSKFGTWVGAAAPTFASESLTFPDAYSATRADFMRLAGSGEAGDGQVRVSREMGAFAVKTSRTAGFFVETGMAEAGPLKAVVSGSPAAVWVTSLDDRPIADSRRLLLSHATDVQNTATVYGDKSKTVLLDWGRLPFLMHAGRAEVSLGVTGADYSVYALSADGSRRARIQSRVVNGRLTFVADTARDRADATCCYEIVREDN